MLNHDLRVRSPAVSGVIRINSRVKCDSTKISTKKKLARACFIYSSERGTSLPPHLRIRTKSEKRGKQVELNVVLRGVVMVCLLIVIRPRKKKKTREKKEKRENGSCY
jgi:hypothetical protein